jgi:flavodoxin
MNMKKIMSVVMMIFTLTTFAVFPTFSASAAEETITSYTIADAVLLQKFLLNVPVDVDLSEKDYDLDNDGKWNVFDLCLMKRELVKQMESEKNTLVVYFSCTDTTERVAQLIQAETNADLFEIIPVNPYTAEDLNYGNSGSRATVEQRDPAVRPEISRSIENMEQYDTVFIGYPIWWGQEPRIIDTFMECYDFSRKTVIPFCTSGSSGIGTSESNLKNLSSETATWLSGRRFSRTTSQEDISVWISSLNIQ